MDVYYSAPSSGARSLHLVQATPEMGRRRSELALYSTAASFSFRAPKIMVSTEVQGLSLGSPPARAE